MEAVGPRLGPHSLVGIDTSVFVYLFEDSPEYSSVARTVLTQIQMGVVRGVISTGTLMEIVVKPLRSGNVEIADSYGMILQQFPNLTIVDVDADSARRAALFRARYNLRQADALQVGTCQRAEATAFVTNDKGLRRIDELDIIILDDYVH